MKRIAEILIISTLLLCGCGMLGDVNCYCCGDSIISNDSVTIEDEWFCDDCYRHAPKCYLCKNKYIENDDVPYLNCCIECTSDSKELFNCAECGLCKSSEEMYDLNGDTICANCLVEYAFSN